MIYEEHLKFVDVFNDTCFWMQDELSSSPPLKNEKMDG